MVLLQKPIERRVEMRARVQLPTNSVNRIFFLVSEFAEVAFHDWAFNSLYDTTVTLVGPLVCNQWFSQCSVFWVTCVMIYALTIV